MLARHSDIRLTIQVYTHVELADQTAAIAALPGPESREVSPTGFEPVTFGFGGRRSDRVTTKHGTELRESEDAEVPVLVPSDSSSAQNAALPPDLADVVTAWPDLPDAIKAGVVALVRAAVGNRQMDET